MNTRNLLLAALATSALATLAQAAAITWSDGTFTTDAILPTHYVQYAVGFGNSSAVTTANGVTFGADNSSNATFNSTQAYASYLSVGVTTGDSGFDTVLTNGDWGGNGTLTLNHLHIGSQYQVLILVDDTRGNVRSGTVSDSVADGSHSSSSLTWGFTGGTPEIGGYYKGTFTANAISQTILVSNTGGNQIDGVVLSTPEPSTFVLGGLGALGLLFAARRRRLQTVAACCLALVGLTQAASATPVNVLLSSNGGIADINGLTGTGASYDSTSGATKLNDGNTDGVYGDGSVAHSAQGMQPLTSFVPNYMEVTIPHAQLLSTVEVFNRTESCCSGRIDDSGAIKYTLTIYNGVPGPGTIAFTEDLKFTPAASLTGTNESGQLINLPTGGVLGDVVRITQNNNDFINLAELRAFTPEPSSFVLGGLGAVGLLVVARRRRKA